MVDIPSHKALRDQRRSDAFRLSNIDLVVIRLHALNAGEVRVYIR